MRNIFAFIVLLLWLLFGAWFYTCKVKHLCNDNYGNVKTKGKVEIIDPVDLKNAYSSVFEAEKDLVINKSEPMIGINDEFVSSLDKIAHFLKEHPKTKVNVTGHYQNDEDNPTEFGNIGLARAELVKRNLIQKGVSTDKIIVKAAQRDGMFDEDGVARNVEVIDFEFSKAYNELNESDIKSAYKSTFALQDLIEFNRDSIIVRLKPEFDENAKNISFYLNKNKDQNLKLEVLFENGEVIALNDMDIGLVRAYNFKQKLVRKGFEKDRIIITSKQGYDIFNDDGSSKPEAVNLNFIFPDKSDENKLAEMQVERKLEKQLTEALRSEKEDSLKNAMRASNLDEATLEKRALINFTFASDSIKHNGGLEQALEDLKAYMKANPEKEVEIIGHTCSMGDPTFNMMLGNKRAEAAKKLLASYGINSAKITIKSKGEYAPIHDNNTKRGRELNRRVEIDIK